MQVMHTLKIAVLYGQPLALQFQEKNICLVDRKWNGYNLLWSCGGRDSERRFLPRLEIHDGYSKGFSAVDELDKKLFVSQRVKFGFSQPEENLLAQPLS